MNDCIIKIRIICFVFEGFLKRLPLSIIRFSQVNCSKMQKEARNASEFEGHVYHKIPSVPNDPGLLEHYVRMQDSERVNQHVLEPDL